MRPYLTAIILCLCTLKTASGKAQHTTPYQCATKAVSALTASFPQFIALVHPVKGLVYHESGKDINDEKPFSRAQLSAASGKGAKLYPITASYDDDQVSQKVNIKTYLQGVARKHAFAATKDVRRNITGIDHSIELLRPAKPGQTLISFHITDPRPDHEMEWACLVVRTEMYRGQAFVVALDYLYWTP